MVGYSQAAESHPDLSPAEYEVLLPSNEAMFNRSDYTDSAPKYNTSSWIPQVALFSNGKGAGCCACVNLFEISDISWQSPPPPKCSLW